MEIIDCIQGQPEWYRARMGIPTASEFSTVMRTKGKADDGSSKERRTYMFKLAGEILTGDPMENYTNAHLERGKVMEEEARELYSFLNEVEPQRVGFIRSGNKGCSPDSLIGDNGMIEIKTAMPQILIDVLLKDEFVSDHKAQCQGGLWIAEREWIDLMVYWPRLPPFIKRAYRDDDYIKKLSTAVDRFNDELYQLVHRLQNWTSTDDDRLKLLQKSVAAS